jgi:hypothetical protein
MHQELARAGLLEDGVNHFDTYLGGGNSLARYITRAPALSARPDASAPSVEGAPGMEVRSV